MKEWTRKLNLLHYVGSCPALGVYDDFEDDHGVAFKHHMGGRLSKQVPTNSGDKNVIIVVLGPA